MIKQRATIARRHLLAATALVMPTMFGGAANEVCAAESKRPAAATKRIAYRWQNVCIHGGGFVTGLVMHPDAQGVWYLRTDVGGAYRWLPDAQRWQAITDWLGPANGNLSGIAAMALDPTDAKKVYLAAGMYDRRWSGYGSLLVSGDSGTSWQMHALPFKLGANELGRFNGSRLAVDPGDPACVLLGSPLNGLWFSESYGRTWRRVESFPEVRDPQRVGVLGVAFDPLSVNPGRRTQRLYVAVGRTFNNLWFTKNAGKSWEPVAGQPTGLRPTRLCISSAGDLLVSYADTCGPQNMRRGAIYRHERATGVWRNITPLQPEANDEFGYSTVAVHPRDANIVMAATMCRWWRGDLICRSTDGGGTWRMMGQYPGRNDRAHIVPALWRAETAPWLYAPAQGRGRRGEAMATNWIGDMAMDPFDSERVIYGTGWGVWKTEDAAALRPTFNLCSNGLEETVVTDLISPRRGAVLLSTLGDIGGFRHETLDESPAAGNFHTAGGTNLGLDVAWQRPEIVARVSASPPGGAISHDGGRSWRAFGAIGMRPVGNHIALAADGRTIVLSAAGSGALRSLDDAQSWHPIPGLPAGAIVYGDRINPRTFYALDKASRVLYRSENAAGGFQPIAWNMPADIVRATVAPDEEGAIWLAAANGLYVYRQSAKALKRMAGVNRAWHVAFGRAAWGQRSATLFIVGEVHAQYGFYRLDRARGWLRLNSDSQQFLYVNALAGDPRFFGRVYIGTSGRGIIYGDPA
ncbi:MAG: hypothetical protein HKL96_08345 [Phycisphaerales bacterium]|nr:hypothetical protein [Phycisphaerales bacterium]